MRICNVCGEEKPLMDFYVNTKGTIDRACKPCRCAKVRANRLVNIEQYREYERGRAMLPHRIKARAAYSATPAGEKAHLRARTKFSASEAGRASLREAKRAYVKANPLKRKAHEMTGSAIRAGRLVRQPCEKCGAVAQAHHDDYSKPLEVRWLCTKHHREWHRHNQPLCPPQDVAA